MNVAARRNAWIIATAAGAVAVVVASFALGTQVRSPWEEAVANSQREPLVTVPVERRALAADVTESEGRYSAGSELSVPAPVTDVPAVVTRQAFAPGDEVRSGDLLAEVSGRPVIGLTTPFRLYRDIRPGDQGPDVAALQEALADLGLFTGPPDSVYGTATATAVRTLYGTLGYLPLVDKDLVEAVAEAEDALADALRAQEEALGSAAQPDPQATPGPGGVPAPGPTTDPAPAAGLADEVAEAEQALADAQFAAQTPLRVAEVTLLPEGGATVLSAAPIGAEPGGTAAGVEDAGIEDADGADGAAGPGDPAGADDAAAGNSVIRLLAGEPSATVRVGVASGAAFEPGATVEVRAISDTSLTAVARVGSLSGFRQADAGTPGGLPGYDATLVFDDPPPFDDDAGVVATSTEQVAPKAVGLTVPLIALRESARGTSVNVSGRGAVVVEVIATGDGHAVVEGDGLSAGDQVVVSGDDGGELAGSE
ncbi:peptidoglycan-binding domain-containing protein [Myceligenerans crystallogenes]|uniref:peptidoglycan-binding domain-containing protein n=1 Tax=Myceligenerans crystallogenes TaxID=316335 RepID=UPI0031DDEDB0